MVLEKFVIDFVTFLDIYLCVAQQGWQRKLDPGYNVMQTLQTLLLRTDWAKSLSYTIDGLMAP